MIITVISIAVVATFLGVPFAFSLLLGMTTATLVFEPSQIENLIAHALDNVNDPFLIGIPMLIIAGEMLAAVGAIEPLIDVLDKSVGRFRGSLGLICVGTSMFFAGSTGSSAAEAAAVASAFKGPMARRGYPTRYVAPLVTASTAIGILFPPSLALVLYSEIVQYPVTELWSAGIEPGIITGGLIAVLSVYLGRRATRTTSDALTAEVRAAAPIEAQPAYVPAAIPAYAGAIAGFGAGSAGNWALPDAELDIVRGDRRSAAFGVVRQAFVIGCGLAIPVIVVAGIYTGFFTIVETAAVLVALVILYGLLVTRIGARQMLKAARLGGERAGAIFLIIVAARLFSTMLTEEQTVPHLINWVTSQHLGKFELLAAINIALLVAGIFMDSLSLIVIAAPILFQLLSPLGVGPVQLAIIMAMNIEIGVVHPPFGGNLFVVSAVTDESVGRIAIGVIPYVAVLLFMLFLVTYVPVPGFAWNH